MNVLIADLDPMQASKRQYDLTVSAMNTNLGVFPC